MEGPFAVLINSETPTLINFCAEWCGHSSVLNLILEQLKNEVGEKARIFKIDVDKNPKLAELFKIRIVPTLALFINGEVKWMKSGVTQIDDLRIIIDEHSQPVGDFILRKNHS